MKQGCNLLDITIWVTCLQFPQAHSLCLMELISFLQMEEAYVLLVGWIGPEVDVMTQ